MNYNDDVRPPDEVRRERLVGTGPEVTPTAPPMPADIELAEALEESRRIADEMEYMTALIQIAELEAQDKMTARRTRIAPFRTKLARLHALGDTKICAAYDELELSFETYILNDVKIVPSAICEEALRGIRLTFDERELIATIFAPCTAPSMRTR